MTETGASPALILLGWAADPSPPRTARSMKPPPPRIELLGFAGCPNTPQMRTNLRHALADLDGGLVFDEIDQEALAPEDVRRGYPAPTVLVNGRDLYDLPAPSAASMGCRRYPGGVPNVKQLAAKLRSALPR